MPWTLPAIQESTDLSIHDGERKCSYREAIREALELLLDLDPLTFIMGEGVDDASGVFGTTLGLAEKCGKNRIVDLPLAENGMTGVAIGAAISGMRPIFVHMRPDFLLLALDQLLNHAAKWSYMSDGKLAVPLTIRCVVGRGWGSAAQHSQAIHGLLTYLPGVKVIMPSTAYDAKGLLVSAVEDNNPVVVLEHRWLYDNRGYTPKQLYKVPIGKALLCRKGNDMTIAALGPMVHEAMKAAEELQNRFDIEVIDIRSIKPWDEDTIRMSVEKTGRLLVADSGHGFGGIGAEISASISTCCWKSLKDPIKRLALSEAPVPASSKLEEFYFPDAKDIVKICKNLLRKQNEQT